MGHIRAESERVGPLGHSSGPQKGPKRASRTFGPMNEPDKKKRGSIDKRQQVIEGRRPSVQIGIQRFDGLIFDLINTH